jgi:hypothetical protein
MKSAKKIGAGLLGSYLLKNCTAGKDFQLPVRYSKMTGEWVSFHYTKRFRPMS